MSEAPNLSEDEAKIFTMLRTLRDSETNNTNGMFKDAASQHWSEKAIWRLTLEAIASGKYSGAVASELAREALTTIEIKFDRWFA
jgi:hypothetical protein